MTSRQILVGALAVAAVGLTVDLILDRPRVAPAPPPEIVNRPVATARAAEPVVEAPPAETRAVEPDIPAEAAPESPLPKGALNKPAQPRVIAQRGKKEEPDPVARAALSLVGVDGDAELVWAQAINNPALPADTRKDLIEDLNEDGFPDPKNVTPDDLPLIVNRLALIEQLGPDAMDDVNVAAFAEAYKDLANMYVRLTGQ